VFDYDALLGISASPRALLCAVLGVAVVILGYLVVNWVFPRSFNRAALAFTRSDLAAHSIYLVFSTVGVGLCAFALTIDKIAPAKVAWTITIGYAVIHAVLAFVSATAQKWSSL